MALVYVCRGKDCSKRKRPLRTLLEALEGRAQIAEVGCQKLCAGPVCGLKLDGRLEWFEEIDSARRREALIATLESGVLNKGLKKRRAKGRAGKLRK